MVGRNFLESGSRPQDVQVLSPSKTDLDLMNQSTVYRYIKTAMPDIIIHAAGLVGGIGANIANPVDFLSKNFLVGHNVILAASDCGIPRIINLGSSCMYPRSLDFPISEERLLSGELEPTNEGYAIAKIAVAKLCEYLTGMSGGQKRYITAIPCNLYGRYDKFSIQSAHLIPAVIRRLSEAVVEDRKSEVVWGSGEARREFMLAGDFAEFLWKAVAQFDSLPLRINVGTGVDHTINHYYREIAKVVGYRGDFINDLTKPEGMKRKLLDVGKCDAWGWTPITQLSEGIRTTYEYFVQTEAT